MAKSRENRENRGKWKFIAGKTIYKLGDVPVSKATSENASILSGKHYTHIYIYISHQIPYTGGFIPYKSGFHPHELKHKSGL